MQIFDNFDRKLAIVPKDFSKFSQIFREKWAKITNTLEICICRGFWGGAPESGEFIKIVAGNQWTPAVLKVLWKFCHYIEFFRSFFTVSQNLE